MKERGIKTLKITPEILFLSLMFIWLIALTALYLKQTTQEKWVCNLLNCTKTITGEEWAKDNCFLMGNEEVCRLAVNGQNQLVYKKNLNLSAIQQCVEYNCIQEIKIRTTNYKYNITQS
ncbi:MAG: hypothetical protein QXY45_03060 [Candidatus Aenigmatarchaeota archaeon]